MGSDQIAFEAALIQKNTPMGDAYERGEFKSPWMWSILEVLKRTYHLGIIQVGKFKDEPPPLTGPKNCDKCTEDFHGLFQEYRLTRDISVFNDIDCVCRKEWESIVAGKG